MSCVSSTSFSLSINGNVHGYFKGKRGLRQGDPMSPSLFTLVMEVLTLLLQRAASSSNFRYHNRCEKQGIINLCFADDLFIFARGEVNSARIIMEALNEFKEMSGLVPSLPKSTVFLCNVPNNIKNAILEIMPFEQGELPVRYLGVPLIATRLLYKDCKILVEKMEKRITDWRNKSLSFARRLQLINSVLSSLHVYWASVFILPARIIKDLEKLMRAFLWCQGPMMKGQAKVSWKLVCLPKCEGGLGINRITVVNKALMAKHIWSILTNRESLWVQWIHSYRLKDRNIWDIPLKSGCSWGWRKMLKLRHELRPFVWHKVGNGASSLVWFDKWAHESPLCNFISPRHIQQAGLSLKAKICELQQHKQDYITGKNLDNKEVLFSSSEVREAICDRQQQVTWANMVWNSVTPLADIQHLSTKWDDILAWFVPMSRSKSARSVIGKLLLAASTYFIWQERNKRLFTNKVRSVEVVVALIKSNVRMRLATLKFRNTRQVDKLLESWEIPMGSVIINNNGVD